MSFKLLLPLLLIVVLIACKKKKPVEETPAPAQLESGLLVLNEGLFNHNNSGLSWINTADHSVGNQFFEEKTGRGLGDTGNDMKRYGGKVYIVVNVSSTIEVLNAQTGQSIRQITMIADGTPKQPRSIAFHGSNAYVTCYDGFVDVIDTSTLLITQRIAVGSNPEGLAVSNGKLYVANSGGLNYPDVDSTVSVIDLTSHHELQRIVVGKNPGTVCADHQGDIYVISRGNYSSIPSRMHRINTVTDTKEYSYSFDASGISRMNNFLLITYYDQSSANSSIALFDATTEQMTQASFIPTNTITTLYGIQYAPETDRIYCCDANGYTNTGYVHVFTSSGIFELTYTVGLNPSKVLVFQ